MVFVVETRLVEFGEHLFVFAGEEVGLSDTYPEQQRLGISQSAQCGAGIVVGF